MTVPTIRRLAATWLAAMGLATMAPGAAWAQEPQHLQAIRLQVGLYLIHAEVAATPAQRQLGLMNRRDLEANDGMLFIFEQPEKQCFWMKNTPTALTIAFLADDGTIVNLADMAPQTEQNHCSAKPVRFALEMPKGWFATRGIKPGAKIGGAPFGHGG